jgi:hypothetical protein
MAASNFCFAHAMFGPRESIKIHVGWTTGLKLLILLISRMHKLVRHAIYQGLSRGFGVPFGGLLRPALFPGLFPPLRTLRCHSRGSGNPG